VKKKTHNTEDHSSDVWMCFTRIYKTEDSKTVFAGQAQCKFCPSKLNVPDGSTTNLKRHAKKHVAQWRPSAPEPLLQTAIVLKPNTKEWQKHNACVYAISLVRDRKPLNSGEQDGERVFMGQISPGFVLPTHHTVLGILRQVKYVIDQEIKEELQQVEYLAMTFDGWSSNEKDRYVALTLHWIDKTWKLRERFLACTWLPDSHTAVDLGRFLTDKLAEFSVLKDKICCTVRDNAAVMPLACEEAKLTAPNMGCADHCINLAVNQFFKTGLLEPVIEAARNLASTIKNTVLLNEELEKRANHKIILDVRTRWFSSFLMGRSLLALKADIAFVLSEADRTELDLGVAGWRTLAWMCEVLAPLHDVSKMLEPSHSVTVSLVIPFCGVFSKPNCRRL